MRSLVLEDPCGSPPHVVPGSAEVIRVGRSERDCISKVIPYILMDFVENHGTDCPSRELRLDTIDDQVWRHT
jgi:hypothetical protein